MIQDISIISLSFKSKIKDAIRKIDENKLQIVFIINNEKRLIGTVSDGDIRRAFLNSINLEGNVSEIMNKNFKYVLENYKEKDIVSLMNKYNIRQIPVLDKSGRIVDLKLLKDFTRLNSYPNPIVIMAGGRGSRLGELTDNCPRPMVEVGGKPMLEVIIDQCINDGFRNFFISVNYLKEKITDYFQDGSKWGIKINYLIEDNALGTAGSLSLLPKNISESFLVLNCDIITQFKLDKLLNFHIQSQAKATLCVREHFTTIPFGVVTHDEEHNLVSFEEKPSYKHLVNAGIYILDPIALSFCEPNKFCDMPELLEKIKYTGIKIGLCPIHEYWLDVGVPDTLKKADIDITRSSIE